MLIKRDCAAGGESKRSKQGFIGLVFQAAVFSLGTAGSRRERETEGVGERLLMRCGGGSINRGRYRPCYSTACYPEVGLLPDLEALTYLGDCLPLSTTLDHNASPFPCSRSPISKQQEAIRSCMCCISAAKIRLRLRLSSHAHHRNAFSLPRGPLKAMSYKYVCVVSVRL